VLESNPAQRASAADPAAMRLHLSFSNAGQFLPKYQIKKPDIPVD